MRYNKLIEGIKPYNRSFRNTILTRSDIKCGVEYEFHPNGEFIYGSDELDSSLNIHTINDMASAVNIIKKRINIYVDVEETNIEDIEYNMIENDSDFVDWLVNKSGIDLEPNISTDAVSVIKFLVELLENNILELKTDTEVEQLIRKTFISVFGENFNISCTDTEDVMFAYMVTNVAKENPESDFSIISTEAGYFSEFLDDFNISDIDDLDTFTNPIIEVVSYCKYLLNSIKNIELDDEIQYMELFNMSEDALNIFDRQIDIYRDSNDELNYFTDRYGTLCDHKIIEFNAYDIPDNYQGYIDLDTQQMRVLADDVLSHRIVVDTDNNYQFEFITDIMTVGECLDSLQEVFEFIEEYGYTTKHSGLHISISSDKWSNTPFNFLKFFTLMQFTHVLDIFPERQYVNNLYNQFVRSKNTIHIVKDAIKNTNNLSQCVSNIHNTLSDINLWKDGFLSTKYQSVKFGDYEISHGRIELRFFGGEHYEDRYDEVEQLLLKSLYMMELSYGDLYDKEYKKLFVRILDDIATNIDSNGEPMSFGEVFAKLKEGE